jgi:hypothetical protein
MVLIYVELGTVGLRRSALSNTNSARFIQLALTQKLSKKQESAGDALALSDRPTTPF